MMNFFKKNREAFWVLSFISFISVWWSVRGFFPDSDVMWHYKSGEFIIRNMHIPHTDIFSWQSGLNWMAHEWLYDVLLYLLYSQAGIFAAKFILLPLFAIPLCIAYFYQKDKIQNHLLFTLFLTLVLVCMPSSFCARPGEFSVIFLQLAAILMLSEDKRRYLYFFALCILAVNIHGGSIAALVILPLLCLLSDILVCLLKKSPKDILPYAKEQALLFVSGFLGSLINPYGIFIYKYAYQLSASISKHISEWQSLKVSVFFAVVLFILVLALGASRNFRGLEQKAMRQYIMIFAFLCKGLEVQRLMHPALCLVLLFAYPYIEELLESIFPKILQYNRIPPLIPPILSTLVLFFLLFHFVPIAAKGQGYVSYVNEEKAPYHEAVQYLQSNMIQGRMYHTYNIGGYLILNDIKTFIDARCDPYMEFFSNNNSLQDLIDALNTSERTRYEAWMALKEKYRFEYALLDLEESVNIELADDMKREGFPLLFENDKVALFQVP